MSSTRIYSVENGFTDEKLSYMIHKVIADCQFKMTDEERKCFDDIEILEQQNEQLLNEWALRIIEHYQLHTCIDHTILIQYLYHDWMEATERWWLYGGVVSEMLNQYVEELESQFMDSWESSMYRV